MGLEEKLKVADEIVDSYGCKRENLIAMMQEVQAKYNYLPEEMLIRIAERLGVSPTKVYSVATFYERFSLEAKGKNIIACCDGTACHVRKSPAVLAAVREHLGLKEGQVTTDDLMFTVETVACLGACGLSPVMTVNGNVYPKMTPEKVADILDSIRREEAQNG